MKRRETKTEAIEAMQVELTAHLRDFRSAVTIVAEREMRRAQANGRVSIRPVALAGRLIWAPALLMLMLSIAAGVVSRSHSHHAMRAQAAIATAAAPNSNQSVDDTALMSEIDQDLSEDTPDSLAPLEVTTVTTTHEAKNKVEENHRVQE